MGALGIDIGTTNAKAVVVDEAGAIRGAGSRPIPIRHDGDRVELDGDVQWWAVVDAVAEATAEAGDVAATIADVGVGSQWSSILPIAADGTPVAPMRLWQDERGEARALEILERHEDAFLGFLERHGIPPLGLGLSLSHILHLQHDHADVHGATRAYVEAMDHVTARLTGRITATQLSVFASQLCDNRTLGATAYDEQLLAWSGVDPSRLPPLIPLDEPVGTVRPDVAERLGIPATATVWPGVIDTQAGAVATGADRPGRAGLSIGTTTFLIDVVPEKAFDLDHELLTAPGPFDDGHVLIAENGLGGRAVAHVVDELLALGFAAVDDALAGTTAAAGPLFLPWLRGSLSPDNDPAVRGGFVHVGLDTTREQLVRATYEGVAHNLAWLFPHALALTGQPVDEVVFVGGTARARGMAEILADVLDRPVTVPDRPELAIARGTALLARCRSGALDRDGLAALAATGATVDPDPATHRRHAERQVQFEAAFAALRPIDGALGG